MAVKRMPYAHFFRFLCRRCQQPLVISIASEAANLEKVDGDSYHVKCSCGWWGDLIGAEAARHWVIPRQDHQSVTTCRRFPNERFYDIPI